MKEFLIENGEKLLTMAIEAATILIVWIRTKKTDKKSEIEKSEAKTAKLLDKAKKQAEKTAKLKEVSGNVNGNERGE